MRSRFDRIFSIWEGVEAVALRHDMAENSDRKPWPSQPDLRDLRQRAVEFGLLLGDGIFGAPGPGRRGSGSAEPRLMAASWLSSRTQAGFEAGWLGAPWAAAEAARATTPERRLAKTAQQSRDHGPRRSPPRMGRIKPRNGD